MSAVIEKEYKQPFVSGQQEVTAAIWPYTCTATAAQTEYIPTEIHFIKQ